MNFSLFSAGVLLLELRGLQGGRVRVQRLVRQVSAGVRAHQEFHGLLETQGRGHCLVQPLGRRAPELRVHWHRAHALHRCGLHLVSFLKNY